MNRTTVFKITIILLSILIVALTCGAFAIMLSVVPDGAIDVASAEVINPVSSTDSSTNLLPGLVGSSISTSDLISPFRDVSVTTGMNSTGFTYTNFTTSNTTSSYPVLFNINLSADFFVGYDIGTQFTFAISFKSSVSLLVRHTYGNLDMPADVFPYTYLYTCTCTLNKIGEERITVYGTKTLHSVGVNFISLQVGADSFTGFSGDYQQGKIDGYDEGYQQGKTDGYDDGYDVGKTDGYNEGKTDGYDEGYQQGKTDGYDEGKTDGYNEGYQQGYDEGYNEGYQQGKADGTVSANNLFRATACGIGNNGRDDIFVDNSSSYSSYRNWLVDITYQYVPLSKLWYNEVDGGYYPLDIVADSDGSIPSFTDSEYFIRFTSYYDLGKWLTDNPNDFLCSYIISGESEPAVLVFSNLQDLPSFMDGAVGAFDDGYNKGEQVGYTDGKQVGYQQGYNAGFNAGAAEGSNYSFMTLLGAVFDAPISAFRGLLNFEVLGVNMSAFVTAMLSLCVVFVLLKLILR